MVKHGVPKPIDLSQDGERQRILELLHELKTWPEDEKDYSALLRRYPAPEGSYAKSQLLGAYRALVEEGAMEPDDGLEVRLRGRPVRTISGVAPVAVLTEPYPCPGTCLFCPNQQEAPKSYLDGEPGVLRALQYKYDPYDQTAGRIQALTAIGHPADKVELLILGGTWSAYPEAYQRWFLQRCFDAMNEEPAESLEAALLLNEHAPHRNVGLVVETRPDWITPEEILRLRSYGVTKVQVGAQSFDERILALNQRGHTLAQTYDAVRLLRLGGFKIVLHWMPNLYGATPESDFEDFARLWNDPRLRPDELKIYPTALLEGTGLYDLWQQGDYAPYDEDVLIELVARCKTLIQPYCRVNRLMRDIPADYIVAGSKKSNLRQLVQRWMKARDMHCQCIRCREVRGKTIVDLDAAELEILPYATDATQEYFLQYVTPTGHLAGFLRLSLPFAPREEIPIPEIRHAAMIREVHVYGPAQQLGEQGGGVQHRGLGTQLIEEAAHIAEQAGFQELAVIAAVGTRPYYRDRGFTNGLYYPIRPLGA